MGLSNQNIHPILLLQEIERRSREKAVGLPQQEDVKDEWIGIGFSVGRHKLVAPLGQVSEILTYPEMSRVPGAKPWVLGIANVRGNLLPIMDLEGFLHGRNAAARKRSRILVVQHHGVFAGLLVDEVLGLRHFLEEDRIRAPKNVELTIRPYVERAYSATDEQWIVFSMHRLAESPLFMQVAI